MRLQVAEDLDPLQFAYQKLIGVEGSTLYMLHQAYAYLDVGLNDMDKILYLDIHARYLVIDLIRQPSIFHKNKNIIQKNVESAVLFIKTHCQSLTLT